MDSPSFPIESASLGAGGRASSAPILPEGYDHVSAIKHYRRLAHSTQSATARKSTEESPTGIERNLSFIQRIFASPNSMSRDESAVPLHLSSMQMRIRQLPGDEFKPIATKGPETPRYFNQAPWLFKHAVQAEKGFGSSPFISSIQETGVWPQSQWPLMMTATSPERFGFAPELERQVDIPAHPEAGLEYSNEESVPPSRWIGSSSQKDIHSISDEDYIGHSPPHQASHNSTWPPYRSPSSQDLPITLSPPIAETAGAGTRDITGSLLSVLAGQQSHSSGPSLQLALAPVGRQKENNSISLATAEPEGGADTAALEKAEEPDLDRLAHDVYAILKRRLSWEKERSMIVR